VKVSDLLGSVVRDVDGVAVGRVHDVRLVRLAEAGGPIGYRVEGLVVGAGAVGTRLGYGHAGVRGPWLVRVLLARPSQWMVPWSVIDGITGEITLRVRRDELDAPAPLAADGSAS
jgi:hypothetical protein